MGALVRSEDLYYLDGNICIIAGEKMVYKVYRGQLAKHCQVFADMFEVGSDGAGEMNDVYDGVPCVRVAESAEAWDVILRHLFTPSFALPTDQPNVFALRVSKKYAMETLWAHNMQLLKEILPWTIQNALRTLDFYRSNPTIPTETIIFAERCGVPELLPLAMYWIIMQPESGRSNIATLSYNFKELLDIIEAGKHIRGLWETFVEYIKDFPGGDRRLDVLDYDSRTGRSIRSSLELPRCSSLLPIGCHRAGSLVDGTIVRSGKSDPLDFFLRTPKLPICSECSKGYYELCNWGKRRIFRVLMKFFAVPRKSSDTV